MKGISEDAYIFGRNHSDVGTLSHVLYVVYGVVSVILFLIQILSLNRLKLFVSLVALPFLSICIAYENLLMFVCSAYTHESVTQASIDLGYVLHSMIVPLFLVIIYEMTFKLHEYRTAHFICFSLEVSSESVFAFCVLWGVRIIALGIFLMSLFVCFEVGGIDNRKPSGAGSRGYVYLHGHTDSTALWLSLIPSIILSTVTVIIGSYIYKYGSYVALSNNNQWKGIFFLVLLQIIGHCFDEDAYPITSRIGELCLLAGLTFLVYYAQIELSMAASYSDFLNKNNEAFRVINAFNAEDEKTQEGTKKRRSSMMMMTELMRSGLLGKENETIGAGGKEGVANTENTQQSGDIELSNV
jgi:hypothetical protein